jgi:hypothetical protein
MTFIPRALKIVSKFYWILAMVLAILISLLLSLRVFVAIHIALGTGLGRAMLESNKPEYTQETYIYYWLGAAAFGLASHFALNGHIFGKLSKFASAFTQAKSRDEQVSYISKLPRYFLALYFLGIAFFLGGTRFFQIYGGKPEAKYASTALDMAGGVASHVVPLFQGPVCLVLAILLWWYVRDLKSMARLNEEAEKLREDAELTI